MSSRSNVCLRWRKKRKRKMNLRNCSALNYHTSKTATNLTNANGNPLIPTTAHAHKKVILDYKSSIIRIKRVPSHLETINAWINWRKLSIVNQVSETARIYVCFWLIEALLMRLRSWLWTNWILEDERRKSCLKILLRLFRKNYKRMMKTPK